MNSVDFKGFTVDELNQNLAKYFVDIKNTLDYLTDELKSLSSISNWEASCRDMFEENVQYIFHDFESLERKFKNIEAYLGFITDYYDLSDRNAEQAIVNFEEANKVLNGTFEQY